MRIAVITPGKGRLKYPYGEVIASYRKSTLKAILDKWDEEHALIDALYTDNKTLLPVGEYEVDLVWQCLYDMGWSLCPCNGLREKQAEEMEARGFETRKVYIASVAPESKEVHYTDVQNKLNYVKERLKQQNVLLDEAKEALGSYKKEVDTIEQDKFALSDAAEMFCKKYSSHSDVDPYECFIAGAKYIKASHVPIEEVISILHYEMALADRFYLDKLDNLITQIKQLIKPQ